jgi:hypothetical protein
MILVPTVAGAAVAVALGVYGRLHEPTGVAISIAGFSGAQAAKSWLATGAFLLAGSQLVSAWRCGASCERTLGPHAASLVGPVRGAAYRARRGALLVRAWLSVGYAAGLDPLAARLLLLRSVHR